RPVGGGTRRAREGYSTDPAVRAGVMVGRDGRWSVGTTAFPDAPFRKSGAGSGDGSRRRSTRVTLEDAASPAAPVLRGRILKQKLLLATLVIGSIVCADVSTKRWALGVLREGHINDALMGWVPLTLAFNQGVAFGLPLPSAGRWIIIVATVLVLFVLAGLFRRAAHND